jgi:hypothetical protein
MITYYSRFSCKSQFDQKNLANQFLLLYTTQMHLKNLAKMKCKIETYILIFPTLKIIFKNINIQLKVDHAMYNTSTWSRSKTLWL